MTQLIELEGDLFNSTADAYAHGVNTEGLMGAGIAVAFKHQWPHMYSTYKTACKVHHLPPGETFVWDTQPTLSQLPCVRTPKMVAAKQAEIDAFTNPRWIYNIASQDAPGPNAKLEWFERGLLRALKHAEENEVKTIAMPRIGCGIGGLDWEDVRDIIEHYAEKSTVDIEVWTL